MRVITCAKDGTRVEDAGCTCTHAYVSYREGRDIVEVLFKVAGNPEAAAYVSMTPAEAEEMARILIVNAWRARNNK